MATRLPPSSLIHSPFIIVLAALWAGPYWGQYRSEGGSIVPASVSALPPNPTSAPVHTSRPWLVPERSTGTHTHGWIWGTCVSYGPTNSVGRSVCTSNSTACKEVLRTLRAVSAKQPGVCNL